MTRTIPILAALLLARSAQAQGRTGSRPDIDVISASAPDFCTTWSGGEACMAPFNEGVPVPTLMLMAPQGFLAVAYPPCGTPEAKEARMCIVWKVVPCPSKMPPQDCGSLLCAVTQPIGCEP